MTGSDEGYAEQIVAIAIDDTTELERQRHELEGQREFAEKVIDSIRESLIILDWELCVHSANQPFYDHFHVSRDETIGRKIYDLGDGQWDIPELRRALEQILPEKSAFDDFEVEHEFEGIGRRVMLLNGRRLDHLDLIILAIRDVTEHRQHEDRQQAFMGELQHRVKNILSNVRALATQTRRRTETLDEFMEAFIARLGALARSQERLIRSPSDEVELAEIVTAELEAIGAERGRTFTATGPRICLSPRDAQVIGMAVHELATNAGKYGALKGMRGQISVEWRREEHETEKLVLLWRERGVAIEPTRQRSGFGSEVIERLVPQMLGGTADLTLHPDGAECRIAFPLKASGPRS